MKAPRIIPWSVGVLLTLMAYAMPASAVDITVNPAQTYQTVDGYGTFARPPQLYIPAGAFWVERPLSYEIYRHVMDYGAGQVKWFIAGGAYPAKGQAYNWAYFSNEIIANAREYRKNGVDRFNFSVLSPPGWMKASGKEAGFGESATKGDNYLLPENYDLMAQYLADFCKMFKDSVGVEPYALSCQNEPYFTEPYESCWYSGTELNDLATRTAARLKAAGLGTRIYGAEHMFFDGTATYGALAWNEILYAYAVHGSGDHAGWAALKALVPNKQLWMTETSPSPATDMAAAQGLYNAIHGGNLSAWLWLGYDDQGTYTKTNEVNTKWTPGGSYYGNKHFFRFARPGAVRIGGDASDATVLSTAFKNANGSYAVVVLNPGASAATVNILGSGIPTTWHKYLTSGADKCAYKGTTGNTGIALPAGGIMSLLSGDSLPPVKPDTLPNSLPEPTPSNRIGEMNAYGDDVLELYINERLVTFPAGKKSTIVALNKGDNIIAAKLKNTAWGGGFIGSMLLPGGDTLRTGRDWKIWYKDPGAGWTSLAFDDAQWQEPAEMGPVNIWPGYTRWGTSAVNFYYQKAKWISGGLHTYFRKEYDATTAKTVQLGIRGNNFTHKIYVNGTLIGAGSEFAKCTTSTATGGSMCLSNPVKWYSGNFVAGKNCVAIELTDASADGNGVLCKFQFNPTSGYGTASSPVGLDTTWKCWTTATTGWNTVGFNDAGWANPDTINAYDVLAQKVQFIYPGTFWYRKKFTSKEATSIRFSAPLRALDMSKAVRESFTLTGRKAPANLPQRGRTSAIMIERLKQEGATRAVTRKLFVD